MASGVFGLKKVYKKQVENVTNDNFNSWSEDFNDTYIIAGERVGNAPNATILKYSHFDSTSGILPNSYNISPTCGQSNASTVSNNNYGYYAGGNNVNSNVISRLDFSTALSSLPGNNLPTNVDRSGSISRIDFGYGYFIAGQNPALATPRNISTITRLDFSTETLSPTTNLPSSLTGIRGFNGTTYGYAVGGQNPTPINTNTVYRLDFSNNTVAISLPGKNLTFARNGSCVNENPLYGYVTSGGTTTRERLDFTTETVSSLSALLPGNTNDGVYFSSITDGYTVGANGGTSFDRLDFSTESVQTLLSIAESRIKSSSFTARHKKYNNNTGTFAYVNQGNTSAQLDKMSYQTETWTTNIDSTSQEQRQTNSASTNNYGYIFGGQKGTGQTSVITRLDFSIDLLTSGKKADKSFANLTLPSTASLTSIGVCQTNSYAYLIGGANANTSYTWRMDFSTEDFVLKTNFPEQRRYLMTVKSPIFSYIGLGENQNSTVIRLNFSTETYSAAPNYPIAQISAVSASTTSASYSYGYFLGGNDGGSTPSRVASIYRLDLSSETFSLVSNSLANSSSNRGGYSYNDLYGYFNVLQGGNSSLFRMDFGTEVFTTQTPSPAARQDSVAYSNINT